MKDRSKMIFGNRISPAAYRKAVNSKKKYIRKYGDDSAANYEAKLVRNATLYTPLGVEDIRVGEGEGDIPFDRERGIIVGNIRMGFGHYRISIAMVSAAHALGYTPYWSMIPAFTEGGKERENLTTLARSAAGVGSAIITVVTMIAVHALGAMLGGGTAKEIEILGFRWFSLIVAVLFVLFTILTCISVKEKSTTQMQTVSVGQMFKALIQNDQALTVVVAIVIINCSIYITSNLVIYFFKYDFGGTGWYNSYTLFNMFGGAMQVLAMMLFYPLMRRFLSNTQVFYVALFAAILGYASLITMAFTFMGSVYILFIPAFLIFSANGILSVLTTVFLANTVDYGYLKNGRRDESVIFSMQTFVVKLASGIAAFAASICLQINRLSDAATTEADQTVDFADNVAQSAKIGLRMTMAIIPIVGLLFAIFWFKKKFILTDEKVKEIADEVQAKTKEDAS